MRDDGVVEGPWTNPSFGGRMEFDSRTHEFYVVPPPEEFSLVRFGFGLFLLAVLCTAVAMLWLCKKALLVVLYVLVPCAVLLLFLLSYGLPVGEEY
jgi:hypothetical protein